MAKIPGDFNREEVGDMGFPLLPKDNYVVAITDSDYMPNSKKNGHFMKVELTVQEGDQEGKKLFRNLNLDNPSKQAVDIARAEWTAMERACGFPAGVEDSEELHGIPFMIEVYIKKAKTENDTDQNDIKSISAIEGVKTPAKPGAGSEGQKSKPASKKPIFDDDDE